MESSNGSGNSDIEGIRTKLERIYRPYRNERGIPSLSERVSRILALMIERRAGPGAASCLGFPDQRRRIELAGHHNTDSIQLGVIQTATAQLAEILACGKTRLRAALGLPTRLNADAVRDAKAQVSESIQRVFGI
jgi:hypothetical protein